jgi:hypothetical protein
MGALCLIEGTAAGSVHPLPFVILVSAATLLADH